jgi:hypothetical protein
MGRKIALFGAALFNGLVAGAAFAIWIDYNPAGMSAPFYTEKMQHAIRVFTIPLPILVVLSVMFSAASLVFLRRQRPQLILLGIATICMLSVALITAFGNIPINNQIIGWSVSSPPADWKTFADAWWSFQTIRTAAAVVGTMSAIVSLLIGPANSVSDEQLI